MHVACWLNPRHDPEFTPRPRDPAERCRKGGLPHRCLRSPRSPLATAAALRPQRDRLHCLGCFRVVDFGRSGSRARLEHAAAEPLLIAMAIVSRSCTVLAIPATTTDAAAHDSFDWFPCRFWTCHWPGACTLCSCLAQPCPRRQFRNHPPKALKMKPRLQTKMPKLKPQTPEPLTLFLSKPPKPPKT